MSAIEVKVPDIGDFKDVPVIEVFVKPGDEVAADQSVITLESEKATVDVPSPSAGTVKEVKLKVGDKVSQGSVILLLETTGTREAKSEIPEPKPAAESTPQAPSPQPVAAAPVTPTPSRAPTSAPLVASTNSGKTHASPSVRAFARELGVDLATVAGSGPKNRITFDDVKRHVKGVMSGAATKGGGFDVLPWPKIDFSKFGEIEVQPLSRIKKLSGANLARNWVMIPHVTQFDLADITELEAHRLEVNRIASADGVKLTMLAFLIKACAEMLKQFPDFNASLDGDNLIRKKYFHIGFAADTPQGLVVPVIRNADKKTPMEIALETAALAKKARDGKIGAAEMQGGCFTISSLGGIGGTAFTPIINAPEVAILGVSKSEMQPRWNGQAFEPRLMLPLSLSYDHRVIDGAAAARFTHQLAKMLADFHKPTP